MIYFDRNGTFSSSHTIAGSDMINLLGKAKMNLSSQCKTLLSDVMFGGGSDISIWGKMPLITAGRRCAEEGVEKCRRVGKWTNQDGW